MNKFELLKRPGAAVRLRNFEPALKGGYRRINGYAKIGGVSSTRPAGDTEILGIHPYALGYVVCAGTNVYYTEDGITWIQVNKDTGEAGDIEANLSGLSTLGRTNQAQAYFTLITGTVDHATNPYGVLYIATKNNPLVHFNIDGTGAGRTFTYVEVSSPMSKAELIENFDHHLCVVDTVQDPNKIYYSATDDYDDYTGVGSGYVRLAERIVGLKSFRDALYIFCENSVHRLVNINDKPNLVVEPVLGNLGCVNGQTIQEVGGDVIFLAPDGLRTIGATMRIGDVELSSVSRQIQPLIESVITNNNDYTISSCVIREKNQYRLFYIDSVGSGNGFIGTLKLN
ncbi:MAG: hypothetical protein KDH96_13255, partial [Candidatus Riesia sp.]|nr:hypothetical protein [Candidatus Riesia sp.]